MGGRDTGLRQAHRGLSPALHNVEVTNNLSLTPVAPEQPVIFRHTRRPSSTPNLVGHPNPIAIPELNENAAASPCAEHLRPQMAGQQASLIAGAIQGIPFVDGFRSTQARGSSLGASIDCLHQASPEMPHSAAGTGSTEGIYRRQPLCICTNMLHLGRSRLPTPSDVLPSTFVMISEDGPTTEYYNRMFGELPGTCSSSVAQEI
jgi:hypothetical protein